MTAHVLEARTSPNRKAQIVPEMPEIEPVPQPLPIKNRDQALRAAKLSGQGYRGAAIGQCLGVTTENANTLAAVGRGIAEIESCGLTGPERDLVRAVAMDILHLRSRMQGRSANAAHVGWWMGKSKSWAAATARKRLLDENTPDHLRLIWKAGGCNGAIDLTPMGWTVALALLSPEDITRATS